MTVFKPAKFQLDHCVDWIIENEFKKVSLQLKLNDLKFSTHINDYLKERISARRNESIDFYITQSSTCCVDLLVTQHVSNLDALIHFGNVCLSKPHLNNQESHLPVLFAFGKTPPSDQDEFDKNINLILDEIQSVQDSDNDNKVCLFYETSMIEYAHKLDELMDKKRTRDKNVNVDIAKLNCLDSNWTTTEEFKSKLVRNLTNEVEPFGYYVFPKNIEQYTHGIYLGDNLSIYHTLNGPQKLTQFNFETSNFEKVNKARELNKRIALVGRLKEEAELNIGVIITNPLPEIGALMQKLETYSKPRKHSLYFISMVQTIDECKIGNFDLCDAFIVVNSCTCSTILKSLLFNRPIITEIEYKMACGFESNYGGVLWPGSAIQLSEDDLINRRKVSDVSLALVQTRNELLERCSRARTNKWSGLEYGQHKQASGSGGVKSESENSESLNIEEGLKGIASSYTSEPLKRKSGKDNVDDYGDAF